MQGLQAAAETLGDIPCRYARDLPDHRALIFEERTTTFAELDARASQVAQALIASGLKPGDRIAHLGKNSDYYFELLFGAAKAGVVMAPVNWRLAPAEMMYIIADSEAKLLFVGPEFLQIVATCAPAERHASTYGLEEPYQGNRSSRGEMRSRRSIHSCKFHLKRRPCSSIRLGRPVTPKAWC